LDSAAEATDAFTQNWTQLWGFAYPSWCLILPTLAKIQWEKAKIVLVAPLWRSQPCYPLLLQLLSGIPLMIPTQENMVISPTQQEFIMPSGVPQLVVWPLSGVPADQRAFQQTLHDFWKHHGEARQNSPMNPSSNDGIVGVKNGLRFH